MVESKTFVAFSCYIKRIYRLGASDLNTAFTLGNRIENKRLTTRNKPKEIITVVTKLLRLKPIEEAVITARNELKDRSCMQELFH
jgi:hypothetical protein